LAIIETSLTIKAPIEVVFDLARSIDMHLVSTAETNERVVDGIRVGLAKLNDTVTWEARHLYKRRKFKSLISAMEPYHYFKDEMLEGDFKRFYHEHFFEENNGAVLMTDKLILESPFGIFGKWADALFLKKYITRFLIIRNNHIKDYAESGRWMQILNTDDYKR
jgi:ligand-binding SRPBCC domain-containing protein